jgi:hypothetical protein
MWFGQHQHMAIIGRINIHDGKRLRILCHYSTRRLSQQRKNTLNHTTSYLGKRMLALPHTWRPVEVKTRRGADCFASAYRRWVSNDL